jgi:large subunit ribosomal protein L24
MRSIRKGDQVIVLSGRDKGRTGTVLSVLGEQVVVETINRVKRHTRPNPQANQPGGSVDQEMPLPRSKVALFNPATKKGERTGVRQLADGRRVRFFKSNGEVIDA